MSPRADPCPVLWRHRSARCRCIHQAKTPSPRPIGMVPAQFVRQRLRSSVVVGVQRGFETRRVAQVVQVRVDTADQLAVIGGGRLLIGCRHETLEVVHRLRQRHLEAVSRVVHAVAPVTEPARPVARQVAERRHRPAGAGPGHAPRRRHQMDGADFVAHPRVGLGFGSGDQFPVGRIRNVLEQVDRGVHRPDKANGPRPANAAGARDYQPPRSASR